MGRSLYFAIAVVLFLSANASFCTGLRSHSARTAPRAGRGQNLTESVFVQQEIPGASIQTLGTAVCVTTIQAPEYVFVGVLRTWSPKLSFDPSLCESNRGPPVSLL